MAYNIISKRVLDCNKRGLDCNDSLSLERTILAFDCLDVTLEAPRL